MINTSSCNIFQVLEVFGAGTAAVVSPVKMIHFHGKDYKIPLDPTGIGKVTKRFADTILGIQVHIAYKVTFLVWRYSERVVGCCVIIKYNSYTLQLVLEKLSKQLIVSR